MALLFLLLALSQKLDEVYDLTVKEKEDVFDFEGALTQPRVATPIEFICDPSLKLAARLIVSLIFCLSRAALRCDEGVFWYCIKT